MFCVLLFIFTLTSCSTNQKFYFEDIKAGQTKIYKFENQNDPNHIIYWKIEAGNKKNTLITYAYNSEFFLENEFHETFTKNNSELTKYVNYYQDRVEPIEAEIIENKVYSWNTNQSCSYKVIFRVGSDTIEVSKSRSFINDIEFIYQKKKTRVKQYEDTYQYVINGTKLDDSYNISYYKKGTGIIHFKMYQEESVAEMHLVQILLPNEFEKLKANR